MSLERRSCLTELKVVVMSEVKGVGCLVSSRESCMCEGTEAQGNTVRLENCRSLSTAE